MKSLCTLFMRYIMEKNQPELLNRLRSRKNVGLVTPFFCSAHSKVVSHLCSLYISSVIFFSFAFDKNDLTPPMRHVPMGLLFILSLFFTKSLVITCFNGKFLLLISVNLLLLALNLRKMKRFDLVLGTTDVFRLKPTCAKRKLLESKSFKSCNKFFYKNLF